MSSHPSPSRELLTETATRAIRYLESIHQRRVSPSPEALRHLSQLDSPLPQHGEDPLRTIRLLDEFGSPATVATNGGRFFGFVIGGALPATIAAHWLSDAWDQNAGLSVLSPLASYLENVVLRWLIELFRLPATSGGAFVTGAQMANFTALAAARHAVLAASGWNVEDDGLFGAPPVSVIVGAEVHVTVLKALALLGLGRSRIVSVPTDTQGRMQPHLLPKIQGPTIVCTQAGNVNTGSFDPIGPICDAAHQQNAWVHVDGAFGLWAATSPRTQHLTERSEEADSWAIDAHKWLNVPHDNAIAFVRHAPDLKAAMALTAAYLNSPDLNPPDSNQADQREPMQWGPESSRRARAVELWAALRHLGREGVAAIIERTCAHAQQFASVLQSHGYEILNDVVLNQVLVFFGASDVTTRIIQAIQADGTCWCGGTVWQGRPAMRISVSSWATTPSDVELSLAAILRIAAKERPADMC